MKGIVAMCAMALSCASGTSFAGGLRLVGGHGPSMVVEGVASGAPCRSGMDCEASLSVSSKDSSGVVRRERMAVVMAWSEGLDHRGGWAVPDNVWKNPGRMVLTVTLGARGGPSWSTGEFPVVVYSDGTFR